jgi:HD-GYP domain-containing protein (c-di-GMP phosphodiesterase class II)
MVRFHHLPWAGGAGAAHEDRPVPGGSHVLHLADRAVVLVSDRTEVLRQVAGIRESIAARRGEVFWPEAADAFDRLATRDHVWLELAGGAPEELLRRELGAHGAELDIDALLELSRLLCRIIDFKSEFTATHSSGVAATGAALARLVGFSSRECRMFEVAAYLHDLGKLAVPSEILEKAGKLTAEEWDVMRTHVFYTYQILCPIEALATITSWGALHQERLNGSGYPFRYTAEDLPLGARIMAVADVFTGITEDRPYRQGMGKEQATAVLQGMAARQELDPKLVAQALGHYGDLDGIRAFAQARAISEYEAFRAELAA